MSSGKKKPFIQFHLINTVAQAIDEIIHGDKYADRMIEKYFKANRNWNAQDRKFVAEAIYEIVRHFRRYQHVAESDKTFDIVGVYLIETRGELPAGRPEFIDIDISNVLSRLKSKMPRAVQESFPDWMDQLGEKEFGSEWPKLMKALNQPPDVYLRVNTIKAQMDDVVKSLKSEQIDARKIESKAFKFPVGLKLTERKNVFATEAFRQGFFEMQDAGSQLIAEFLEVIPGQSVVDACAGSGGKSLHLAALLENKGQLLSMDIHDWKLKDLQQRAQRAGVKIIETKKIEGPKTIKFLEKKFDRVLLDVPCSGMGVLKRNPDSKWKLQPEEIEGLHQLQRQILTDYSKMAKDQSVMVYATCSILRKENEEQVQWFLSTSAGKEWTLDKELRIWPHIHGFDGFYAARFKKKSK